MHHFMIAFGPESQFVVHGISGEAQLIRALRPIHVCMSVRTSLNFRALLVLGINMKIIKSLDVVDVSILCQGGPKNEGSLIH